MFYPLDILGYVLIIIGIIIMLLPASIYSKYSPNYVTMHGWAHIMYIVIGAIFIIAGLFVLNLKHKYVKFGFVKTEEEEQRQEEGYIKEKIQRAKEYLKQEHMMRQEESSH